MSHHKSICSLSQTRKELVGINAWSRDHPRNPLSSDVIDYVENWAHKRPKFAQVPKNRSPSIDDNRAALKASPSVVALVSYTGDDDLIQGCGTVIECDDTDTCIVLTSANLIRSFHVTYGNILVGDNSIADNLKVVVNLADGQSCEGEVLAHDFHLNLAAIRFKSDSPVPTATIRQVDDSMDLNPNLEETSFQLRPHSSVFKLVPGDAVVAVGRYFTKPFGLMVAPGEFRVARRYLDCKELFNSTCIITRCGDGCPLVNHSGEVIGISFFNYGYTPFLPINIAYKWWELFKNGKHHRPSLGMEAANFYTVDLNIADRIMQSFPGISTGVIVEEVISGSSAESAGLHSNDVITKCAGKVVKGFLEFLEILWDNVGHNVDLDVARVGHRTLLPLKMMVVEPPSDKLNRWPYLV